MSSDPREPRAAEAPVSSAPGERVTDPAPPPPAATRIPPPLPPTAASVLPSDEHSWKAWAVRLVLLVLLVLAVYQAGTWVGRARAGREAARGAASAPAQADAAPTMWTCSMHPQIQQPRPGQCPLCFMDLIPVAAGGGDATAPVLTLSPRARTLAGVETTEVKLRELTRDVRMVGKIAADETRITYVSSYVPGRLDRLYVNYTGILVRKGDHLAEIYSPDLLVAQREYLLALDAVDTAKRQGGQNSAALQSANAMVEAARRRFELWGISDNVLEKLTAEGKPSEHIRIDSPLEGWVLERQGYQGMYVETGTRIFTLADLRVVWVMLDAYELDLGSIRLGQEVEFEAEALPGRVFAGKVGYLDPVLRSETRTVKVRVNVDNADLSLRPEMFVRARLKVRIGEGGQVVDNALTGKWMCYMHPEVVKDAPGACDVCGMDLVKAESIGHGGSGDISPEALSVPVTAVLLTGPRAVVYVEEKDGDEIRYEGREVRLGPRAGEFYTVIEGLEAGERVATRGALMIDSALQIQARPSMMQARAGPGESQPAESEPAEPAASRPSHYVAKAMYHQHAAPVIDAYLALTKALAGDDAAGSAAAVEKVREALKGAEPHGLEGAGAEAFRERMTKIGESLPPAKSAIAAIRNGLPALTRAMEDYLREFGHNKSELAKAFCPMAFNDRGAFWFQPDADILNPYFGAEMLHCGVVKAWIGADGKVEE